ncbi:hypothetical protein BS78_05G045100 [Paspalum vaginatum]|nr:hypothetical protein BS78_05G045100 [Paspalum vaginatum]
MPRRAAGHAGELLRVDSGGARLRPKKAPRGSAGRRPAAAVSMHGIADPAAASAGWARSHLPRPLALWPSPSCTVGDSAACEGGRTGTVARQSACHHARLLPSFCSSVVTRLWNC